MWFSETKLKPQLKMAVHRFQIISNKKAALLKQHKREIATLLNSSPRPKEEKARIRAEAVIRDDFTVEAYEILQLSCELLAERVRFIGSSKKCPPDMVSCISTLIWAADRVDVPELIQVRKQFKYKYGARFIKAAEDNEGDVVNERVSARLSVIPPSGAVVRSYLLKIAEEFDVNWEPSVELQGEMLNTGGAVSVPSGYSVPVAEAADRPYGSVPEGLLSEDLKNHHRNDDDDDDDDDRGEEEIYLPSPPKKNPPAMHVEEAEIYYPGTDHLIIPKAPTNNSVSQYSANNDSSSAAKTLYDITATIDIGTNTPSIPIATASYVDEKEDEMSIPVSAAEVTSISSLPTSAEKRKMNAEPSAPAPSTLQAVDEEQEIVIPPAPSFVPSANDEEKKQLDYDEMDDDGDDDTSKFSCNASVDTYDRLTARFDAMQNDNASVTTKTEESESYDDGKHSCNTKTDNYDDLVARFAALKK
eukprot:CAMPEP_0116017280 /NCGR_PEP_ID=MMETSP0321-20121206/7955_1 /TAXON_ID=163516 /ORGANISM="Leptocylindrus danicus var. danicus, Strain B650" /LENGTH=472 /DNA_ID=CAMNT_0003487445 /DNA_START=112 /DNA_END=1530 /DNA_ORIENTATION=-